MSECNFDYQLLVDKLGQKEADKVWSLFCGRPVYFTKRQKIKQKHKRLFKDFQEDNLSYRQLAEKYDYSESHVRAVINKQHKENRKSPLLI